MRREKGVAGVVKSLLSAYETKSAIYMAVSADTPQRPRRRLHSRMLLLICCASLQALPARAAVTDSDLQIIGRTLSFLDKPMSGEVTLGIVYVADNPQSAREAQDLQHSLANGLRVGNVVLKPLLVPMDQVAQVNADVLFLTSGLGELAKPVGIASRSRHLPCITTDLSQVQSGRCAVGVSSQPTIEILVNRAAALANGTTFSTLFRMMINEI
jgi:hypothetical protein